MNWTEAQSYCREHHTDLASVRNMTENQKVADLVPAGHIAWIGLYRDSWKWSDGSDSSFRHWAQGQPDNYGGKEACVVGSLRNSGTWLDIPCNLIRPFVCYTITTKQVIKVRLERKDASLDLNDPAVMEQMLKEVQQRLKDQGVKGDVRLSCKEAGRWKGLPQGGGGDKGEEGDLLKEGRVLKGHYVVDQPPHLWQHWRPMMMMEVTVRGVRRGRGGREMAALAARVEAELNLRTVLKNMTEAQRCCREKHTHLATTANMEDVKILNHTADNSSVVDSEYSHLQQRAAGRTGTLSCCSEDKASVRGTRALLTELPGHPPATSLKCHIRANREPTKMDAVLLLIMAASGLSAVSSQLRRQYHFVYDQKNMTEAQKYCRETYTDLATVDNMEDVKILNDTVDKSKGFILFWIGLYDDVNSWRWSLSNTSFYRDGEAEFRLWQDGQPNNINSREHCTVMDSGGRWSDVNCMTRHRLVCMDVRGLKVTFVLIETLMNWTEAQSYCREHHTDLASVRNMTENQKVADLVPAGQEAFIGLYRDSWKWSDGSDSSFRYWRQGQPVNDVGNDACVVADFSGSGEWWDDPCGRNRPFVCYTITTKQVIKVRLERKDSSLDLNDPAVMEQMLKEVQQRLKDQGVKGDVKLSWRKQADGKVFHKEEEETKEKKTRRKRDEF
ncbi:uncharacterized protein AB9X84_010787 [Acanthopagrus schlegelii]